MFSVGWQAVDMTTSAESERTLKFCGGGGGKYKILPNSPNPPRKNIWNKQLDILPFSKSAFKSRTGACPIKNSLQQHLYLCGPAVSAQSPLSADSRCRPCCPRSPRRSTADGTDGSSIQILFYFNLFFSCQLLYWEIKNKQTNKERSEWRGSHLAAGDGEIGKYAVLLVFVARVRFQALRSSEEDNVNKCRCGSL